MKKRQTNWFVANWLIVVFLLFYALLIAYIIIGRPSPFFDWDEAIYAQVGREMIRSRSFLVPLWQGKPWLDKPPVPSLLYGVVQLIPVTPEISTRLATLILSILALILLYLLILKITKQKAIAVMTVIITAFLPGFFQRSQALNVDVFLLIGWLGYVLWYRNFWVSIGFLAFAVLSKSLLGYYPPLCFLGYYTFQFLTKQIDCKNYVLLVRNTILQIFLVSLWFIGMLLYYKYPFIQYHFIDSHFKRVASSIEQHFGQRTFYIDVLIEQFKWFVVPAVGASLYLTYRFFREKSTEKMNIFLTIFFVPWFVFLNLTKTKIAWYIYPTLPQFALLSSYPLYFLRKKKVLLLGAGIIGLSIYFTAIVPAPSIISASYSRMEDHHRIALSAKENKCKILYFLVDETTRTSYATLKSMDLVISTTTWWGNHPSVAFYSDAKTTYLYSLADISKQIRISRKEDCFIVTKTDYQANSELKLIPTFQTDNQTYTLLRK